jgi:glycosyltransferase involved in cell wall biosynthesis
MRVALLSHSAPAGDAIGRQLAEKVAVFADRGADVRLFVTSDARLDPTLVPFTHKFAPAKPQGPHWRFLKSADLISVEYSQHDPLFDLLPLLCGGRPRIIFDYHGVTPPNMSGANHRDALERGCRHRGLVWTADAAIVHSRFARDELLTDTDFPADRTHVVSLPVDTTWLSPGPSEQPLRSTLGMPSDCRILLFVGRLASNKRVPVLVEALARLKTTKPAVHAVMAGDCGDAYEPERDRCRERAARLGVSDRLHFLGKVDDRHLRDLYRDADVLVMPSIHEGFCLPVVEAMACGMPVVAARAAALPETVGDAGLTFMPDDADDLARVLNRLFATKLPDRRTGVQRIAIVAPRFGHGVVGGAETSLRTLARSMSAARNDVEVFTIGETEETISFDGMALHRFQGDERDPARWSAAAHALRLPDGLTNSDAACEFFDHSPRSTRLVAALRQQGPFHAIVVGPYLHGLAYDVATEFGGRVLLLPCFHDEPFARLPQLRVAFEQVGGLLYHSQEERAFAEVVLGLNHLNAHVIGTLIDAATPGDQARGRQVVGTGRRYVLYCGRYCREKGLPELIAFAGRYATDHPERLTFAFAGEGDANMPAGGWARDCGRVSDASRRDLMAGADALVLLSPNESLSLAVLEAQAQGTPIIVSAGNAVLMGHLDRGAGGVAVDGYEAFAAALDDLWDDPAHWRSVGRAGREYVRRQYADAANFKAAWQSAVNGLDQPLAEKLALNGRRRAKHFDRAEWRERFSTLIDCVLASPNQSVCHSVEVTARSPGTEVGLLQAEIALAVRLTNHGNRVVVADGHGRSEIVTRAYDSTGNLVTPESCTPLPAMLLPGRSVAAIARVAVPSTVGDYEVRVGLRSSHKASSAHNSTATTIRLTVTDRADAALPPLRPLNVGPAMRRAMAAHELPAGYADVSNGRSARLKRWLKQKLLHNFQTAYVDVLSRQQTAFNRQVLAALAELHETQAAIAHAAAIQSPRSAPQDGDNLRAEIRRVRRRNRRLRRRVARLEALFLRREAAA